ncbi:substrate-binding periplasmic protein [Niveibacterium terrae]|uniref:substrate-binding periplasmic protein n=1 Tax=Niveibacterium terrae TaxID=3373598 RepID=UPI003A8D41B8
MFARGLGAAVFFAVLGQAAAADQAPVRLATFEYPPYAFQAGASAQGLSADLVREAFARMGRRVSIEFYPLNRGLKLLEAGEVSGFFTIKKTPERIAKFVFPHKPMIRQDYVFFIRKGSRVSFTGSFADLSAATIGVVMSTSYGQRFDEAAARGAFAKIEAAASYEQIFRMLVGERVDAVICSRLVGLEFIRRIGATGRVEISGPPVETTLSYLAFTAKKADAALAPAFDKAMEAMERDGSLNRILELHEDLIRGR